MRLSVAPQLRTRWNPPRRVRSAQLEYGFGDVHSAEWVFPIQKTNEFWYDMAISLELKIRINE